MMQRRTFLGSVSATSLGMTLALGAEEKNFPEGSGLVLSPASIQCPRRDGAQVVWAVSRLARGWVEWRDSEGNHGQAHTDAYGFRPQGHSLLRVPLHGLQSGTTYEIRAVTEAIDGAKQTVEGAWKEFRTLAGPKANTAHFVVWNDTHQHADTIRRLHQLTPKADFLLWNGDTCNNWTSEDLLPPTLLHPAGCDISNGRGLYMTMGNHDVRGKYAFRMPDYAAFPGGRSYYALRHGPLAAIFLNTGEDKPDDHPSFGGRVSFAEYRKEQAAWLARTIERPDIKEAPFRVLFCHLPMRLNREQRVSEYDAAGQHFDHFAASSRDLWHESLVKWGTQVVISGHTHRQEWVEAHPDFPYAQLVGGGPGEENARLIEGKVEANQLLLTMRNLRGEITLEKNFAAL